MLVGGRKAKPETPVKKEGSTVLFVTYWELNENMPVQDRLQAVRKVTSAGLFPAKGVKIIRWDGTPDGWGIVVAEADTAADIAQAINVWRVAAAGFFKATKTAPAVPIQEDVAHAEEVLKALSGG